MKYFRVKNWDKYQHYKDRSPQWIKLYNSLLDNFEFLSLSDESKGHLMMIFLLASRCENKLPYCEKTIKKLLKTFKKVKLFELFEKDFLEEINEIKTSQNINNNNLNESAASNALEESKQNDCLEKEKEKKVVGNNNYFWNGKIIKLDEQDYRRWEKSYPHIHLQSKLQYFDDLFSQGDSEKWFVRVSAMLASDNAKAAPKETAPVITKITKEEKMKEVYGESLQH